MGFDLKRTYFSLTAFVVLLVAFISGLSLLSGASAVAFLAPVPFEDRYPPGYPPVEVPVPPMAASGQATPTPAPAVTSAPGPTVPYAGKPVQMDDWELRSAREQVAMTLAAVIVALPIWWFHWRRYRRLAQDKQAFVMYRVYAYAFMVVALITMIVAGGNLLGQVFRALLGVADLSTRYAQVNLAHQAVGSGLGVVWAFLFWVYHWHVVETVPEGV